MASNPVNVKSCTQCSNAMFGYEGIGCCGDMLTYPNIQKETKVIQIAGYVMEMCAYHHGEASLYSTTIGLAQDFIGSNNVNILYPGGSFGSRIQVAKLVSICLAPTLMFDVGRCGCILAKIHQHKAG